MFRDIETNEPVDEGNVGGRSVIAVIGINHYKEWPRLDNAVNDAAAALQLFQRLGFSQVTAPLFDAAATGDAMQHLVKDELATLSMDDQLVLFFAGHGHTQTMSYSDASVKTGYLIPADAEATGGRVATWIRLDSWLSDVARLPPRHILVIIDACGSGIALGALVRWRAADPLPIGSLAVLRARRSRRVITSALDDQLAMDCGPVPGHSLFTGCLIEGLRGGIACDGRRITTGSELGLYLQRRVSSYPASTQTPDFGALELDDRGELVLPVVLGNDVSYGARPPAQRRRQAHPQRRRFALKLIVLVVTSVAIVGTVLRRSIRSPPPAAPSETSVREIVPVPDASIVVESPVETLKRENPFQLRDGLSIQAHLVTCGEYAHLMATTGSHLFPENCDSQSPLHLGRYTEVIEVCAALHARLPTERECKVVRTLHPDAWTWGAMNASNGLVFICNHAESALYVDPSATPKNIGIVCVQ